MMVWFPVSWRFILASSFIYGADVQTAVVAKEALEGHCIYDGGYCKLHISYSRHTDLSIKVRLVECKTEHNRYFSSRLAYRPWLKHVFQVNNDRSRDYTIPTTPVLNTQPSILGHQPYNGTQYAQGPDPHSGPQPSAGWNPTVPQSMPMQMHNYPYAPPGGPGAVPSHLQNGGAPHSSPMRPYHHQ